MGLSGKWAFAGGTVLGVSAAGVLLLARGVFSSDEWLFSLCTAVARQITPEELWTAWSLAPEVFVPLLAYALLYAMGWTRIRRTDGQNPHLRLQALMTTAALVLLGLALVSPLCRLSAVLASAHMVQHLILVAIAPPLLWLGSPRLVLSAVNPRLASGQPRKLLSSSPYIASGFAYGLAIWLWHTPPLYQAALTNSTTHLLMLVSLLVVSLWFWRTVIDAPASLFGAPAFLLFGTLLHTGLLGALLTFSPAPWYPLMARGASDWGLLPIEDQQLAGLLMWVPMGGVYLISALVVVGVSLGHNLRREQLAFGTASPAGAARLFVKDR